MSASGLACALAFIVPALAQATGAKRAVTEPAMVPSAAGVGAYTAASTRGGPPRDPLRDAIVEDAQAEARREGRPVPVEDARLDWAMADLARHLGADEVPALDAVAFLLSHYGLVEASPHFVLARGTAGADAEIRARAREEFAVAFGARAVGRIGVGIDRSGHEVHVVAGFQETPVVLGAAIPRRLASAAEARVAAHIDGAYRDPELVITSPDGRVQKALPVRGRELGGAVRCAADGRYQIEIMATGPIGATVLANFPVYCGVSPPAVWHGRVGLHQGSADPVVAEQEIVALVNRDRARAGLPPVVADARLAAIARAHCQDMIDHDFVGHLSPRTGRAMDRVRRAGLNPEIVFENIAETSSPDQAESGFLGSPGHRGNLLDPRAHRIGVGVVLGAEVSGRRPLFVTQLLTN